MTNFYRRRLPHYQPAFGEFFITFRLGNSLPRQLLEKYYHKRRLYNRAYDSEEYALTNKTKIGKLLFKHLDKQLDNYHNGTDWLKQDRIAEIVANKIHELNNDKYLLLCYCIMPNHVHLLLKLSESEMQMESPTAESEYPVTTILKLIKGSTAYAANKALNRTGKFWQHESYDHLVRDNQERKNIIRYILMNPVKANLVKQWKDWKWKYCNKRYVPIR